MKQKFFIFLILIFSLCCYANNKYNVLINPEQIGKGEIQTDSDTHTLFILDYSNSMNEMLFNKTKYELLLESMRTILSELSPSNNVGVRIYGHHWGFTAYDACRASNLIVPIGRDNFNSISQNLSKYSPKGMTPITYSLKQAVTKDFRGKSGDKHIILITDGGENCDESPCKYAMELVKYRKDIKIDVIAFNIDNQDDLDQLQCVAQVTKGKIYNADTKAELVKSLNRAFRAKKEVDAKIIH